MASSEGLVMDQMDTTDSSIPLDADGALIMSSPGSTEADVSRETIPTQQAGLDIASLFGETLPTANELETPPDGIGSKASQRFQQLANARREALEQNAYLQAQIQQAQAQAQQAQQQSFQQAEMARLEVVKMQAQLAAMQAMQRSANQVELPPGERLKQEWLSEGEKLFRERTAPLEREIHELKQTRENERRQAQLNADARGYDNQALDAARRVTLRDLPPETAANLERGVANQILAVMLQNDTADIKAAAEVVRQQHFAFAKEFLKAKQMSQQVNKAAVGAPPVPPATSGRMSASAPEPSHAQVVSNGFRDYLDWQLHGSPPLRPAN